MKVIELDDNTFYVRLEKNELIVKSLIEFHELYVPYLKLCEIKAIGAIKNVELGYINLNKLDNIDYNYKFFKGNYELTSMIGNLSIKNNKSCAHIHVQMADENYNAIGGHLKEAQVAITLEIFIKVYEQEVEKKFNEDEGVFLLG